MEVAQVAESMPLTKVGGAVEVFVGDGGFQGYEGEVEAVLGKGGGEHG